jgi:hypothetical protein
MFKGAEIFETNYTDYCREISKCDFDVAAKILKVELKGDGVIIRFINHNYQVSGRGIQDESGRRPDYGLCVILAKYLLLCPDRIHEDLQWASFKDFKKDAGFINGNFFTSDTEMAILNYFSGNIQGLIRASEKLGGSHLDIGVSYDVSMKIDVLPRISLLVLFNDRDDQFDAQCRVLFQKHSEFYLDPESLVMTGVGLARHLIRSHKRTSNEL